MTYTHQDEILDGIRRERKRQDEKWGADRSLSDETWLRILVEEVGEAAKLLEPGEDHFDELPSELRQVAAVAVAWLEQKAREIYD